MTQYNCKYQINREKIKKVARYECWGCEADAENNPKCPDYKPIKLKDLNGLKGHNLEAKINDKKSD